MDRNSPKRFAIWQRSLVTPDQIGIAPATLTGPVIILGLPRSYSTLACAMIGQHPRMYGLLEMQFLKLDTMRQWWRRFGGSQHEGDGLRRAVAEIFFGDQSWESVERARRWLWERRDWKTIDVYNELSRKREPLTLVFKSLITGVHESTIRDKLKSRLARFPRAKWIHLVRHPLACGRSYLQHLKYMARAQHRPALIRSAPLLDRSTQPPTVDPQLLWYRVHSSISGVFRDSPSDRYLRLRGEDLLTDTSCTLERIASWLGISTDRDAIEAMRHPELSPFACFGPVNAKLGGDPKFFRHPQLRTDVSIRESLETPLPWRRDHQGFRSNVIELARQFGYE